MRAELQNQVCNSKAGGNRSVGPGGVGLLLGQLQEGNHTGRTFCPYCWGQQRELRRVEQATEFSHADIQSSVRVSQRSHRKFRDTLGDGRQPLPCQLPLCTVVYKAW